MPIDKTEKLKTILALLKDQTLTPSEVEKFLGMLINAVKQTNEQFKILSAENIQEIRNTLSYINVEHSDILKKIDQKNVNFSTEVQKKIDEMQNLLYEIQANPPKDGQDGIDGLPGKDGKDGKDGSPDSAEQIRDKLETLDGEDRLDAKAIKNLPKYVDKTIIAHSRNMAWYDETTLLIENPTKIKFAGAGVQATLDSEGSVLVTISGGAAANESNGELLTDSGNHINFTFANAPTGISVVWRGETGQIQLPSSYSVVGTTLTFTSTQTDGEGNPFTIYANSKY